MSLNAARNYRVLAAESTNLVSIVVQAYNQIVRSIYEAIRGIENHDITKKTDALGHAIQLISHLEAALDHEAGPEVARNLERFYQVMRQEIVQASATLSVEKLRQVAEYFLSVQESWQEVEKSVTAKPVTAPLAASLSSRPPQSDFSAMEDAPSRWSA